MSTMTVDEVGHAVGYPARRIRDLYRAGKFPPPIDPTLNPVSWRWSPAAVAAYVDGQWAPAEDVA